LARRRLQEGIYFHKRQTPRRFFAIVFLAASPHEKAEDVAELIAGLWSRYEGLKQGVVEDLERLESEEAAQLKRLAAVQGEALEYAQVPAGRLQVLVGFGAPLFELDGAVGTPSAFDGSLFDAPTGAVDEPICKGAGIFYEPGSVDLRQTAVAFQFTADTLLAVERAVVETWKYLWDAQTTALQIQAAYTGARRDDGRSWIDFFDGTSNLRPDERREVIVIPRRGQHRPADAWTGGGTYLAFMRLYIDLEVWRQLDDRKQEVLVGRRKLTGFPLLTPTKTLPGSRGYPTGSLRYGRPPHEADPLSKQLKGGIEESHVQRVNHHNQHDPSSADPLNRRIFRQGYPFFEPRDGDHPFRVGLNFVSFQWTPVSLLRMFDQDSWLRDTNFGGPTRSEGGTTLLTARAAGVFLVPPRAEVERFPGEGALTGGYLASKQPLMP
jgi:deferrochelatase/peroxidase EfeB